MTAGTASVSLRLGQAACLLAAVGEVIMKQMEVSLLLKPRSWKAKVLEHVL